MLAEASLLAQTRPNVTTPVVAFTAALLTEVSLIVICNTTGTNTAFSIYHNNTGVVFNDDFALYKDQLIEANDTFVVELPYAGAGISVSSNGSIGLASGVADALNFSLYGKSTRATGF